MINAKNIQNIINPPKDFMVIEDILKSEKYLKSIYEKIFSEISSFLEKGRDIKIRKCSLREQEGKVFRGKFVLLNKDVPFEIKILFERDTVSAYLNNVFIIDASIFGATIDKEKIQASNIKIDLASVKQKMSQSMRHSLLQ